MARRYAPADGSSTRGGSKSVRGRVRSPHISGGRPAAGSQRAYSLGLGQTDGRNEVSSNPPPFTAGITSGQRILTKSRIAEEAPHKLFLRGFWGSVTSLHPIYSMGLCVLDTRVSRAETAELIEIALQV